MRTIHKHAAVWSLSFFLLIALCDEVRTAEVDFAHEVVPILKQHCVECHAGGQKKGGLSLNTRQTLLAGGESGAVVVTGKADASELIRRLTASDKDERMPPKGEPLAAAKIDILRRWINEGAKWTEGFAFRQQSYEPPLFPRRPELPPIVDGRSHPVDRLVDAYLAARPQSVRPGPSSDSAFARRVYLDVIGLLPPTEQLKHFVNDTRPDKRERLIQELLGDEISYAEHWLTFWNDLLRNDYIGTGFITGGRKQITGWLYRSLVANKPYDVFVRELIAPRPESEGYIQGIRWRGNVSASQTQEVQFSQSICQSFLGINMKCASCHDSFVDRWKLSEAIGLAAVYATEPIAIHRCDAPTGETAKAAWIFPELGQIDEKAPQPERLRQLASLVTHPDNGRFTRTIVNRIWHRLMGRGIVHPVDAMHTEPWNADLLDYLAVHLADNRYDLKKTIELICTSQIYQAHVSLATSTDGPYEFSGPIARRLTAEQFMDAVWQLTRSAPLRFDAAVVRFKVDESSTSVKAISSGRWIWSQPDAAASAAAGATLTTRRRFQLDDVPTRAVLAVTCDNEYTVYLNGQRIAADGAWESAELVPLEPHLKKGENEFLVVAKNLGDSPNPAGLLLLAHLRLPNGESQSIVTDESWTWTQAKSDNRGKFRDEPTDWLPVSLLPENNPWTSVESTMRAMLAQGASSPDRMVRASLVKADAFMRALGRPNRDQIVTMRPSELTTLEAIDLANGQVLADALVKGGSWWSRHAEQESLTTEAICHELFQAALARLPNAEERQVALEMIGKPPQQQGLEDCLWSILMLPEFQLVR